MKFMSKYRNHKLVMKPTMATIQNGLQYTQPGKSIQFENFTYKTDDKEEIKFLKTHKLFGSMIFDDKQPQNKQVDELEALKLHADELGIEYHPNIGADTLKKRIEEKLAEE